MSSTLFETLMKDREAELRAELQAQFQSREAELLAQTREQERAQEINGLQDILSETILIHFPDAPLAFTRDIQRIAEPAALRRLIIAVQQAGDVAAVAHLLREAAGEP